MRRRLLLAGALALCGGAATARTIGYPLDPAMLARAAAEQGLDPTPAPSRWTNPVLLSRAPDLDDPDLTKVRRTGLACRARGIDNPLGALLASLVAERNPIVEAQAGAAVRTIRLARATTMLGCVGLGRTCTATIVLDGTTTPAGGVAQPLHVELARALRPVGACAGLVRAIGLVSREAALRFLAAGAAG